jgi:hypothetical protein
LSSSQLSADISNNRFFVLYIQRHGLTPKKPTVSSWGYTPASDHLSQETCEIFSGSPSALAITSAMIKNLFLSKQINSPTVFDVRLSLKERESTQSSFSTSAL